MKPLFFLGLFLVIACSDKATKKPAFDDVVISVALSEKILITPVCHVLDQEKKPLFELKGFPGDEQSIRLPRKARFFILRCAEMSENGSDLVVHTVFEKLDGGSKKAMMLIINPLTELAYRLSHGNIASFKETFIRILQELHITNESFVMIKPAASRSMTGLANNEDRYSAFIALLLSVSGLDQGINTITIVKLKGLLSEFELLYKSGKPLSQGIDVTQIREFLDSADLSDALRLWFLDKYQYRKQQKAFQFQQQEVIRTVTENTYQQLPIGGNGEGIIVYASSNNGIAVVDGDGKVSLLSVGNVTITATKQADNDYTSATASYELSVKKDMLEQAPLYFEKKNVLIHAEQMDFQQTVQGGSGRGLVFYRSADNKIATVDNAGRVTVEGLGVVRITATKGADNDYHKVKASYQLSITGIVLYKDSGETMIVTNMQHALDNAKPGDVFTLAGTHHFQPELRFNKVSGSEEKPVIIQGHPDLLSRISGVESIHKIQAGPWQRIDDGRSGCVNQCYKTTLTQPVKQIWIDNVMQSVARWPNYEVGHPLEEVNINESHLAKGISGKWWDDGLWARISTIDNNNADEQAVSDESVEPVDERWFLNNDTLHDLTTQDSFLGGRLLVKSSDGRYQDITIIDHQAGSSRVKPDLVEGLFVTDRDRYIVEHKNALDKSGEYFYDNETKELRVWVAAETHPSELEIRGKTQLYSFDLTGGSYIMIRDLDFYGTTIQCGREKSCAHIYLTNNQFIDSSSPEFLMSHVIGGAESHQYNGLYFANYTVAGTGWTRDDISIISSVRQKYWLPPESDQNKANIPLKPLGRAGKGENIEMHWLPIMAAGSQQVLLGTSVDNLTMVCSFNQPPIAGVNRCKINETLMVGRYYWRVISVLDQVHHYSPIWQFDITLLE